MRKQIRRESYSNRRRELPRIEELEQRQLLSVSASLLKDLNLQPASSDPEGFFSVGAITYFAANDGVHGHKLWRTDGTSAGTYMVKDTNPYGDSDPSGFANLNGNLLFEDGANDDQLWISNGTAGGTTLLRQFSDLAVDNPSSLTVLGKVAVFYAIDSGGVPAVWRTDGTAAGTYQIGSTQVYTPFTVLKGSAFFAGSDANGIELWRTNGTGTGTHLFVAVSKPIDLTVAGSLIFFGASDGVHPGTQVWRSDGTAAGTFMTRDINPNGSAIDGAYQDNPNTFVALGNQVFFDAYDGQSTTLWASDGSTSGTRSIPGPSGQTYAIAASTGFVYFDAADSPGMSDLWRTDGTAAGTSLVYSNLLLYGSAGSIDNHFFFIGFDPAHGNQLWVTDGTAAGTTMLEDFGSGTRGGFDVTQGQLPIAKFGNYLYFMPNTGPFGFWKTDGTVAGTTELASTVSVAQPDYLIPEVYATKTFLLFDGSDVQHGVQLWRSFGTVPGTSLLKHINAGTIGSLLNTGDAGEVRFVGMNGSIYFTTSDPELGQYLWKTNGAAGGTVLVAQIAGPQPPSFGIQYLTVVGNTLFFISFNQTSEQLWESDGTTSGTALVSDAAFDPGPLVPFEGRVYFGSLNGLWESDGTANGTVMLVPGEVGGPVVVRPNLLFFMIGAQLWESDGTAEGSNPLQDVNPGFQFAYNSWFAFHGELFYGSNADGQGFQLWKTDGTSSGTQLVKVLVPGGNAYPTGFVSVQGVLYFISADATNGGELWRSDGTSSGTQMILDSHAPEGGEYLPGNLTNFNGRLFFTMYDGSSQEGLWQSDGTTAGTTLVAHIGLGADYFTRQFSSLDGLLFFQADDGHHGPSLWESDGTAAGTFMVPGIRKEGASTPAVLTVLWNRLFFFADDGIHGFEPWVLAVTAPPAVVLIQDPASHVTWPSCPSPVSSESSQATEYWSFDTNTPVVPTKIESPVSLRLLAQPSPREVDTLLSIGWDLGG